MIWVVSVMVLVLSREITIFVVQPMMNDVIEKLLEKFEDIRLYCGEI